MLWFASGNLHKREELSAILRRRLQIPADAKIPFAPEETGGSFLENALIKGRALYRLVGEPVIADDSGLEVDALGGRPGVFSARYGEGPGGKRLSDGERNALLLHEMAGQTRRSARFVCAMALVLGEARFCAVQETLEGELLAGEPRGTGGFGYDPILYLPDRGCTVAELPAGEKNLFSHRAKAARRLAQILGEVL